MKQIIPWELRKLTPVESLDQVLFEAGIPSL